MRARACWVIAAVVLVAAGLQLAPPLGADSCVNMPFPGHPFCRRCAPDGSNGCCQDYPGYCGCFEVQCLVSAPAPPAAERADFARFLAASLPAPAATIDAAAPAPAR